jgi:hypothetical protein
VQRRNHFPNIRQNWIEPSIALQKDFPRSLFLWIGNHAAFHTDRVLNADILQYDAEVEEIFQRANWPFVSTFNSTLNLNETRDGLHYGLHYNLQKAQLLLNYLDMRTCSAFVMDGISKCKLVPFGSLLS